MWQDITFGYRTNALASDSSEFKQTQLLFVLKIHSLRSSQKQLLVRMPLFNKVEFVKILYYPLFLNPGGEY